MRAIVVFIAACSGAAPATSPPQPPIVARRLPRVDAAVDAPLRLAARGGTCSPEHGCAEDLLCMPAPGGYCLSFCGGTGTPCGSGGTCVETVRAGELCLASCATDADCRVDEGYVCDPQWKGCFLPNLTALVAKACPGLPGVTHDAAFGASVALSTADTAGIYQFEPSAVITDDGGVTAMYITRSGLQDGNPLGVARIDGTGQPTVAVPFTSDRASHFDPWLARDAKGTLYAVWLGFDGRGSNQQIGFATSTDRGATWSKPIGVDAPGDCKPDDTDCLDKPMIAIGPDPRHPGEEVVYVMYASGEEGLRVRASRDHGKTFGDPITPLAGIYGNAAIGTDGRLHIITLRGSPHGAFGAADQTVEYAVSADGGATFTTPQTISRRDEMIPFFFANPTIALDDKRGWIYLAYTRGGHDGVWDLVIAASKDKGKTWKHTRLGDDPACAIHMVPNLAVDPTTGTLHVAWYDSRGDKGRFAHATCAIGAASCKQAGAINDVAFAELSTERHGTKWIGEYESLLVDDKRRVLHAVWTEPVDEGGKIVARIFHAVATLPKR